MPVINIIPGGWQIYMKIADLVVVEAFRIYNYTSSFLIFCEGEKNKHIELVNAKLRTYIVCMIISRKMTES